MSSDWRWAISITIASQSLAVLVDIMVGTEAVDVYIYSARYSNGKLLVENQQKLESECRPLIISLPRAI